MSVYAGAGVAACLVFLCVGVVCSADGGGGAYAGMWSQHRAVRYGVESAVLVTEAARRGAPELGYKLAAELRVRSVWASAASDHEHLLQFDLLNPKMLMRGKHPNAEYLPVNSVWDSYRSSSFFVHWNRGLIENIYLEPDELLLFSNFKKALASLFQFQVLDGETTESDLSGTCDVLYESQNPGEDVLYESQNPGEDVRRKIKRRCRWEGHASSDSLDGELFVRRIGRMERAPGGWVRAAGAEEHAGAGGGEGGEPQGGDALKLRSWLRVKERAVEEDAGLAGGEVGDALLDRLPAGLVARGLAMSPPADLPPTQKVATAITSVREALSSVEAAGGGGTAAEARAALDLLPALRAASGEELRAALSHTDNYHILTPLCRLLALAGTWSAHEAVLAVLHLRAGARGGGEGGAAGAEGERRAVEYFASLPHAAHVQESVILDALKLSSQLPGAVGEAALLGAAGAAAGAAEGAAAEGDALRIVRDHIVKEIAKCKSESCLTVRLHALGNLRLADTAPLLLQYAAGGGGGGGSAGAVREAALRALAGAGVEKGTLSVGQLAALVRIVLQVDRPAPIQVRALALDAALTAAAVQSSALSLDALPLRLGVLAAGLSAGGEEGGAWREGERAELRRYLWARLEALGEEHRAVRAHVQALRSAAHSALLHHYHPGTTSVLTRAAGGEGAGGLAAPGWRARLRSGVLSARALLRDAHVALDLVRDRDNSSRPLLAVELWARGLAGLAGGAAEEGDEEEEVSAGLGAVVRGVRRGGVTLFASQSALLAAVWAGAGSEPTGVVRAQVAARGAGDTLPLSAGAAARREVSAAGSLALDAHGSVSLWSRAARTAVVLRVAGVRRSRLSVEGAGHVEAHGEAAGEGELHVAADLDFYSAPPVLCVRAHLSPFQFCSNVTASQRGEGRGGGRRWGAARRVAAGGSTLSLGADNDRACRHLAPADVL